MIDNQKKQSINPPLELADLLKAVLASDLAQEVDAEFSGRRKMGFDVPSATSNVFGKFRSALSSAADGPVVLIALAALQMRDGYLQSVIKDAAIDLIDTREALNAYRSFDSTQRNAVRNMLDQFSALLQETVAHLDE